MKLLVHTINTECRCSWKYFVCVAVVTVCRVICLWTYVFATVILSLFNDSSCFMSLDLAVFVNTHLFCGRFVGRPGDYDRNLFGYRQEEVSYRLLYFVGSFHVPVSWRKKFTKFSSTLAHFFFQTFSMLLLICWLFCLWMKSLAYISIWCLVRTIAVPSCCLHDLLYKQGKMTLAYCIRCLEIDLLTAFALTFTAICVSMILILIILICSFNCILDTIWTIPYWCAV